ncbi:hypothetical protein [Amycolatopsis sp. cmx-11-51]|uniref:hypothetical protein n=2 Tax=unclassified Amycolatopsis TaxID=2618356 RepID=UPI0039E2B498
MIIMLTQIRCAAGNLDCACREAIATTMPAAKWPTATGTAKPAAGTALTEGRGPDHRS